MKLSRSSRDSIINLCSLLRSVASNPENYYSDVEVCSSLRSQGAMAKFSRNELNIKSMSLNWMKHSCEVLPQGFMTMDSLRKAALKAISKFAAKRPRADSERSKKIEARNQEVKIKNLEASVMWLIDINADLRTLCFDLANGQYNDANAYCLRVIAEIDAKIRSFDVAYSSK